MSEQQLGYLELRLIQAGENLSGIDREQEGGGQCLPVSLCSCSQPDTMLRDTGTALPPTAQPTLTHTHTQADQNWPVYTQMVKGGGSFQDMGPLPD